MSIDGEFMKRSKKSRWPIGPASNGLEEHVVQDAESYQRVLDIAAQSDGFEAIRQGIDDIARSRTRPAREASLRCGTNMACNVEVTLFKRKT